MDAMNAAMEAGTSDAVKLWMNWMMLVFAASLIFMWKFKPARWVFAAFLATGFVGFGIWSATQNIHLLGLAHLLLWLPLAVYLWKTVLSSAAKPAWANNKIFFFWICLLFLTIIISLVFDVRDIFLVLTGVK